MLIKMMKHV